MDRKNYKDEYPKVPDNIYNMIVSEVDKQLESSKECKKVRKLSFKKMAVISLAAALTVGTTVFAANKLYEMYVEKEGDYGLKVGISSEKMEEILESTEVPKLSITPFYIPEGMENSNTNDALKYSFVSTPNQGGFSINSIIIDETFSMEKIKEGEVPVTDRNVVENEILDLNGREGIYLRKQDRPGGEIDFNQKIYIPYPEYGQVIEVFVGEDIEKNEAVKFVQDLVVSETGAMVSKSEYGSWKTKYEVLDDNSAITYNTASEDDIYKIGEEFISKENLFEEDNKELGIKVTDVQVADDFSLLNPDYIDEECYELLDENGKIKDNTIYYMKSGDGVSNLDESEQAETQGIRLVYITAEYTNHGDEPLEDTLFFGQIIHLDEHLKEYSRESLCEGADSVEYAYPQVRLEMPYMDVFGGPRNNNYIEYMEPGETVTIHLGYFVHEDELDSMYMNFSTYGGNYQAGNILVDIRR